MALRFPKSMAEFEERFSTESACRDYFFSVRWPEGWRCPRCASEGGWRNGRGLVECRRCGHQSSLTAGTVFHGSKTPLRLWFKAIFLMVSQKNGVSAKALQHLLGVSYPTAWTWLQKLRRALSVRPHAPLSGLVEVDDAYWGGYRKGEPGRRKGGGSKDLLVVAVEDKGRVMGRVRLSRAPDHTAKSFSKVVKRHVAQGSLVRTDGLSSYGQLPAEGYVHMPEVIGEDKSRAVEVLPRVHRVISLLKRWLLGTHQGAPRTKHMDGYLEEFEFRFNRRTAKHRSLLFERLVGFATCQSALPYWRIIQRQRPNQPLHVVAT
jgi:transposase-like protein